MNDDENFFDVLLGVTGSVLQTGLDNISVSLKTNYTPEIGIPLRGNGQSGGLISSLIGLRGGLIIRNERGAVIDTIGDPAPTDPIRAIALLSILGGIGFVFMRGVMR